MTERWRGVLVSPDVSFGDAIAKVDSSGLRIALVVDSNRFLLGVLTDGDIRRAVLSGVPLDQSVSNVMNRHPTTGLVSSRRPELLKSMKEKGIQHLPLLDGTGRVSGLVTLDALSVAPEYPNRVVIMAGGRGSRLQPLTDDRPKPLLLVGGRPILELIVTGLADAGFTNITISVNYRAEMIREYFGSGQRFGVNVEYLQERTAMGTAGALSMLEAGKDPILVLNGDLLTRINLGELLDFHVQHEAAASIAVREGDYKVPYGVVTLDGHRVLSIVEKPVHKFMVNAGIYALSTDSLAHIPPDEYCDMPELIGRLMRMAERVVAFRFDDYWIDIGRLDEYERARREWSDR